MKTEHFITLKLPAEVHLPGTMPLQILTDTLWALNLGIQSTSGNVYTVTPIQSKPASCTKCGNKAVFKQGSFFYCPEHYRDSLIEKITKSFDNSIDSLKR